MEAVSARMRKQREHAYASVHGFPPSKHKFSFLSIAVLKVVSCAALVCMPLGRSPTQMTAVSGSYVQGARLSCNVIHPHVLSLS